MTPVRVIHLSDVHVRLARPGWRARDYLSKRAVGWLNLTLSRRGRAFRRATELTRLIADEIRALRPDGVVFSGDATALGFAGESQEVARALGVADGGPPGVAVPGNHDYYTNSAVAARGFEDAFGPWMEGERVDDHPFPFARQVGVVWFIGVNSAVPNRLPFDTRGNVGPDQLARLITLLGRLSDGPRVIVTHYPYVTSQGIPERPWRALRDRDRLAQVLRDHGVKLWLCGHRHRPYHLGPNVAVPFLVYCSGSATQTGLASISELTIDINTVAVRRLVHSPAGDKWTATEPVSISLDLP